MCLCMCVCVAHVCIYKCMCVYIYIKTYIHTSTRVRLDIRTTNLLNKYNCNIQIIFSWYHSGCVEAIVPFFAPG